MSFLIKYWFEIALAFQLLVVAVILLIVIEVDIQPEIEE